MASKPTVAQVISAVQTLYHSPEGNNEREVAEAWLKGFQESVFAWEIADQCLHQQPNVEVCFFAAQTIKLKVQLHFRKELPREAQEGLRASLLENLKNYATKNQHAITKQLAVAVADLAIQMYPHWQQPVHDLIMMLGQSNEHTTRGSLLEVLMVMPEEIHNTFLPVTHEDRKQISFQMGMDSTVMYPFMAECWNVYSKDTTQFMTMLEKMFKCLSSWLFFGGQGAVDIEKGPLLPAALMALKSDNSELAELGREVISAAMYLAKNTEYHPGLSVFVIPQVLSLQPLLVKSLAEEDIDFSSKLVLLFVELADNLVGMIVDTMLARRQDEQVSIMMNILMKCVQQTDVDIFLMTFNYWYEMADALEDSTYDKRSELRRIERLVRSAPDQIPKRDSIRAELRQLEEPFVPVYVSVYEALAFHMKCPADLTGKLKGSTDLADFRDRGLHLVEETCFLMGADALMAFLWNRCKTVANNGWVEVETQLCMMVPVVEKATDSSVAMEVLEALTGIGPEAHPMLYHTVLKLAGRLSIWAKGQTKAIGLIWGILTKAIKAKQHMQITVKGLKDLCRECRADVAPYLVDLIKLCMAADDYGIDKEDTLVLLEGAARVIAHLPTEHITQATEMITTPLLTLIEQPNATNSPPVTALDRLAIVFKHINIPKVEIVQVHPLLAASQRAWSSLMGVNTRFPTEKKVIEMSNRSLKYILRNLNHHGAPLVPSIIQHTSQLFQTHKHASCLYVATSIIKVFGKVPEFAEGMIQMYRTLATPTFHLLSESEKSLIHHPDVVEDYFRMSEAILDCRPEMLILTELAEPSFQLGCSSMLLQHRDAYDMAVTFMIKFVGVSISRFVSTEHKDQVNAVIRGLVGKHGQGLVNSLITGATGDLPAHLLPDVAAVLFELQYILPDETLVWVTAAMHMDRVSNSRATVEQITDFVNKFRVRHKALVDFREDVVKPFGRIFERYNKADKLDKDDKKDADKRN
eukprot:m.110207 g.110207  ORF g.110207 m.110207 type:complete len:978 (+) comp28020_c0_seq1:258-3191(+)